MVLNIEQLPEAIREDIEIQSLGLLSAVKDVLVIIGGWGARAWTHHIATRNTLDVDAITRPEDLRSISRAFRAQGMAADEEDDWGVSFHKMYIPSTNEAIEEAEQLKEVIEEVQLRVDVSRPKIYEKRTPHYFEFNPKKGVIKKIATRGSSASVECRVANSHELAANKAGLPADYKNIFDLALLLSESDLDEVVRIITSTDDWSSMVLRRVPKIVGRVQRDDNMAHILLRSFNIGIDEFVQSVMTIGNSIV
ncbi:MAG: hypothetical protein LN412_03485 [Candidatus Thermoplasmatota archaeon]|nr:hypothetical protein [Candidatus Thermoplasmatota archaeon]